MSKKSYNNEINKSKVSHCYYFITCIKARLLDVHTSSLLIYYPLNLTEIWKRMKLYSGGQREEKYETVEERRYKNIVLYIRDLGSRPDLGYLGWSFPSQ